MYHYCIDARCCSDSRYRGNLPLRGFSSCRGVARPCQTTLFARIELRSGSRSPPLGTMLDMKFLIQGMVAWGPRLFNNSLFDSETRPSSAPSYTLPPLASAFLLLLFFFFLFTTGFKGLRFHHDNFSNPRHFLLVPQHTALPATSQRHSRL